MRTRKQISFNELQDKDLELWKARSRLLNDSEAVHAAIAQANRYMELVTKLLETQDFEIGMIRKTKSYQRTSHAMQQESD
jgi:hypothetical protein